MRVLRGDLPDRLTSHLVDLNYIAISEEVFQSFTPEQQAIVQQPPMTRRSLAASVSLRWKPSLAPSSRKTA
jgi:folate-dependent tRNA-U54 methylase TrmFO/GidA